MLRGQVSHSYIFTSFYQFPDLLSSGFVGIQYVTSALRVAERLQHFGSTGRGLAGTAQGAFRRCTVSNVGPKLPYQTAQPVYASSCATHSRADSTGVAA